MWQASAEPLEQHQIACSWEPVWTQLASQWEGLAEVLREEHTAFVRVQQVYHVQSPPGVESSTVEEHERATAGERFAVAVCASGEEFWRRVECHLACYLPPGWALQRAWLRRQSSVSWQRITVEWVAAFRCESVITTSAEPLGPNVGPLPAWSDERERPWWESVETPWT
jgi:hypothetical protein